MRSFFEISAKAYEPKTHHRSIKPSYIDFLNNSSELNDEDDDKEEFLKDLDQMVLKAREKCKKNLTNEINYDKLLNISKDLTLEKKTEKTTISAKKPKNYKETRLFANKKLMKISADISKLYHKINELSYNSKIKYGLDLTAIQPLSHSPNFKHFLPYLPAKNTIIPKKSKNFCIFQAYSLKKDDKIPQDLLKKIYDKNEI